MFPKRQQILKLVYGACAAQFALVFIYVNFYCRPRTKDDLLLVGLSAVLGLLISGTIRRHYKVRPRYLDAEEIDSKT